MCELDETEQAWIDNMAKWLERSGGSEAWLRAAIISTILAP